MSHEVESMFSAREVPWHGLGTITADSLTSVEAIKEAGLDWNVSSRDVYLDNGNVVEGYKANVRDTDDKVLGLVSDRYQIVQNEQAFDFVDELLKSEVRYETAGSLFGGKKIWLLANMPKVSILGDDIKPFMVFVNGHDGMTPTSCFFSAVRVVCNNTFTQAWNGAKTKFTTKHMGNLESKIKTAEQILGLSNRYMTNFEVVANELQDIKIPDMIELTSSLVPYPKDKEILTPRTIANIDDVRSGILYRLNAPDLHKFGNSGWAWLNAVSDYVCHADPVRANSNFKEKRFDNILNGNTLMDEGYSLLMDRFMKKIIQVESEVRKPLLKIKVGV